jgi:hypothetical protein
MVPERTCNVETRGVPIEYFDSVQHVHIFIIFRFLFKCEIFTWTFSPILCDESGNVFLQFNASKTIPLAISTSKGWTRAGYHPILGM